MKVLMSIIFVVVLSVNVAYSGDSYSGDIDEEYHGMCIKQYNELKDMANMLKKKYGSEELMNKNMTNDEKLAVRVTGYLLFACMVEEKLQERAKERMDK